MSQTPPWLYGWEDLSCDLYTHQGEQKKKKEEEEEEDVEEEYLRILMEAQRESCEPESRLLSPSPSSGETEEARSVYGRKVSLEDFLWDWSSRVSVSPPPEWRLRTRYCSTSSLCDSRKSSQDRPAGGQEAGAGDQGYFSLLLSNIISLIIGTGLGVWLYKRNVFKHSNIFI